MATINLLTDEILVEVFGYLNQKTVKNCSLVCKRKLGYLPNICHIFECSTISTLEFKCCTTKLEEKLMFEFLSRQKVLQDFKLYDFADFFNSPGTNFEALEFRLKSFTYRNHDCFEQYQEFIRFLEPHKRSLATLSINIATESIIPIEQIRKYVLENFSNLKDLKLEMRVKGDSEWEPTMLMEVDEPRSYTYVTNIERFKMYRDQRSQDEKKRFMDMFPKIKHLEYNAITRDEFQLLKYISETKVNLESLEVDHFDDSFEECFTIFFPNLKKLSVDFINHGERALSSFVKRHSRTLEKIKVSSSRHLFELTINEIIKCESLKQITIRVCENNTSETIRLFHEISFRSKPLTFIFNYKSYKFPEDKIFWDKKVKTFAPFLE